ncbi:MAG TPA: hypothetical protein PKA13_18410 [Geminicoccaceae bacterium]|nr:hypothetical protein [Geminicoccus sp.]HMU51755.1 hypothetical protein [Geminicoccaceae bacterium]
MRRGACPSLAVPMATGDGLLVRLNPVDRQLSAPALAGLAHAASELSNGIVEITARGSLQLRGFTEAGVAALAGLVARLDIELTTGVAVETGALAGLDPAEIADPRPLAAALRGAIARSGRGFAPKASVVVDGGGVLRLDHLACDVRLEATEGGQWSCRGRPVEDPAAFVLDGLAASCGRTAATTRPPAEPIGVHRLRDGRFAVGVGLPFGQAPAESLEALACSPAVAFRLSPGRALLAVGLDAAGLPAWTGAARARGLVTDPADPRRAVAACPGCPACGSGEIPARAMAEVIAARAAPLLDGSLVLHVSGCGKACAHPRQALLTLTGVDGACDLALDGVALARLRPAAAMDALARLADLVSGQRSTGETAAGCLGRLGGRRLGRLLRDRVHA